MNKRIEIIVLIIIIMIFIPINMGCMQNNPELFSTLEIIDAAELKLKKKHITGACIFNQIALYDSTGKNRGRNGKYPEWKVIINVSVFSNKLNITHVRILFDDGQYKEKEYKDGYPEPSYINVSKIKIDSDEAYDIAIKESEIKSFINKYNAYEDGIEIYSDSDEGIVYYSVSWAYESGFEEPGIAIYIDATTGDVLKVFTTS